VSPRISVFTPVFNRREWLVDCIESVTSQDYDNFEYVISDNCSTDGSYEVACAYAAADHRLRVRRNPSNLGMVANTDLAFSQLVGELAILVSSDDLLLPGALARLSAALDDHPQATFATSPTVLIAADGAPLARQYPVLLPMVLDDALLDARGLALRMIYEFANYVGCPPLFRRNLVSPDRWAELDRRIPTAGDMAIYIDLLSSGPAYYCATPLRAHRVHDGQYSTSDAATLGRVIDRYELLRLAAEVGLIHHPNEEREALLRMVWDCGRRLIDAAPVTDARQWSQATTNVAAAYRRLGELGAR